MNQINKNLPRKRITLHDTDRPDYYHNKAPFDSRVHAEYTFDEIRQYKKAFSLVRNDIIAKRDTDIKQILPCKCAYLRSLGGKGLCNICTMAYKRKKLLKEDNL